jgi:hypothetical protein
MSTIRPKDPEHVKEDARQGMAEHDRQKGEDR